MLFARGVPKARIFLAATAALVLAASAVGPSGLPAVAPLSPPGPPQPFYAGTCMPSCDPDDARFFGVAGSSYSTLEGVTIVLYVGLPAGTTTFSVGIFDGDHGESGGYWDDGSSPFAYHLFKDPRKNGTTSMPFDTFLSGNLPDDAWYDKTYSTDSGAMAPSGNYFYRLEAAWDGSIPAQEFNNFKVRSTGQTSLAAGQDFGIDAGPQGIGVDPDVGSGDPNPGDTNDPDANSYNGQFIFFFYVPAELSSITFWDGDADRRLDTDDPNTPNTDPDGGGPAQPEGANPGAPADDPMSNAPCCTVNPAIFYDILDPDGNLYTNTNPSGNQEWERFVIGDSSSNPDVTITYPLQPGLWRYRVQGMDAHNLNVIRSTQEIFSTEDTPLPVNPAPAIEPDNEKTTGDDIVVPYAHTVTNNGLAEDDFNLEAGSQHGWSTSIYHDLNGNGQVDAGEPAITKTGPLGPGASINIVVTVTVPNTNQNDDDVTTVVASSTTEWALQDDAKDTTHVRVNQQPTADSGGPYSAPEGTSISFDASGSTDPDNDPLTYRWDFQDDGTWDTGWSGNPSSSHTFGDDWTGQARLEVSDGNLTDDATVSVTVTNVDPTIEFTLIPSGDEGDSLAFEARVTDPGSDDIVITWSNAPGPDDCTGWGGLTTYPNDSALFPDPDPSPDVHPRDVTDARTIVCGDDSTFNWQVHAFDDDGGFADKSGTFDVSNLAPSLTLPPPAFVTNDEGVAWTLTATAEDPGSDDLTFTWTWQLGPTDTHTHYNDGVGPDPDGSWDGTFPFSAMDASTHTYADDGTYVVTLRVEDDDGGFLAVTTTFSTANLPPALTVSPPTSTTVDEGTSVTLTASAEDPGSDDLTFTWTWQHGPTETRTYYNDGVGPDPDPSPSGTFPFTATDSSSRTYGDDCACLVTLRVDDDDGGFLSVETAVTVRNVDPTVSASGTSGDEAAAIAFAATFSDPGFDFGAGDSREDFTAMVDWGDGSSEPVTVTEVSGAPGVPTTGSFALTHVYGDNGAFPVIATVCDDDGGCGAATATITVANVDPSASIDAVSQDDGHVRGHTFPLEPITFNGSGGDVGSDDLTLSWSWGDGSPDTVGATHFNDGIGPDPSPSPGGTYPFAAEDTVQHTYVLPGDYVVTLTVRDDDGGTAQTTTHVHVTSPSDLKGESIARIKALKQRALDRGDATFVRALDDAERFVWRSLGYADPMRPSAITATVGTDVSVTRNVGNRIDLLLGPSWTPRLAAYGVVHVLWEDGVVTTVDFPDNWPTTSLRFHDTIWVDAWKQDLSIESRRDQTTGDVTLKVHAHDASLGVSLSLDADPVANLSFAYEILPWWIDGSHLDPTLGASVFLCERDAVNRLVAITVSDDDDDDDDDDEDDEGDGGQSGAGILGGDDDDDDDQDDDQGDDDDGSEGDNEGGDNRGCGCPQHDDEDNKDCPDDDDDDGGDDDEGDGDGGRSGVGVLGGDDEDDDDDDEDNDDEGADCGCGDDDDEDEREGNDDGEDDDDGADIAIRTVHCLLTPSLWTAAERSELDAECDAIANLLVKADEILARIALGEAKETPVKDPNNQDRVDQELAQSETSLAKGYEEWDLPDYADAICGFLGAWQHAERAIAFAQK